MGNGSARGHPADFTGAYLLVRAQAVFVLQLSFEQIGQSRQANMRMLSDIHPVAGRIVSAQHMIEKYKGTDTAAFR